MFSSKTPEWETPQDLFNFLDKIYSFVYDLAATKENTKCKNYFGLDLPMGGLDSF